MLSLGVVVDAIPGGGPDAIPGGGVLSHPGGDPNVPITYDMVTSPYSPRAAVTPWGGVLSHPGGGGGCHPGGGGGCHPGGGGGCHPGGGMAYHPRCGQPPTLRVVRFAPVGCNAHPPALGWQRVPP